MLRLPRHGGDRIKGQADEPAHEAQAGTQPFRRKGEIDRHLPMLQIPQAEIAPRQGGAEPGIIEPGGVTDGGGEHRAALAFRAVQMRCGGPCRETLTAFGVCQHIRQYRREIVLRGGQNAAQLGHRAPCRRQGCDVNQQSPQQLARGCVLRL